MARPSGVVAALLALFLSPAIGRTQQPDTTRPARPAAARAPSPLGRTGEEQYEPVFEQFRKMAPSGEQVATVRSLTLQRDVTTFHLEDGKLYLATPVAGRTIGAVFVGRGSVSFAPPVAIERAQLKRVLGDSVLDARISAATFVFTDSTLAELEHHLTFGAGGAAREAAGPLNDALYHLVDGRHRRLEQPTLMAALLNGSAPAFFYGHVKRQEGEDLMFMVDPQEGEPVLLLRGGREGERVQIVSQFGRAGDSRDSTALNEARGGPLRLGPYRIEATIAGGLGFSAVATIRVTARREGVRWARFILFGELTVDSLRDEAATADTFYRAKESPELWVRFDAPLRLGETRSLRIAYHGDLIGFLSLTAMLRRAVDAHDARHELIPPGLDQWMYIKASETWFPRYAPRRPRYGDYPAVDMDLTFHTPTKYRFLSVGRLVDTHQDGNVVTTHWVTEQPASEACFNLGEFSEFKITDPRIPPVTVQINADGHRVLNGMGMLGQRDPEKDVGGDVANSLAFFSHVFGAPLFDSYSATEIPFFYGQAFPGLMYLSMGTFQTVTQSGGEETFRAHEMAHQWWGIGVEPAGYRDIWMSEGFAEFSGLWYMQLILHDNEKFFKQLKERREAIHARRDAAPPIALGWRVAQGDMGRDYSLIVYYKGAWVLHMLRNLMIDLRTMKEDAFTATMQDFYQQYRGRRASTQDFQQVVERHVGASMDWFFDEWVRGTAIPTYTFSWHADPTTSGHYALQLRVRQEDVPKDFVMPVPLQVDFADGRQGLVRVTVRGPLTELKLDLPGEPKQVQLNPLESVLAQVDQENWH